MPARPLTVAHQDRATAAWRNSHEESARTRRCSGHNICETDVTGRLGEGQALWRVSRRSRCWETRSARARWCGQATVVGYQMNLPPPQSTTDQTPDFPHSAATAEHRFPVDRRAASLTSCRKRYRFEVETLYTFQKCEDAHTRCSRVG